MQKGRSGRVAGAVARPGSHRSVRAQLRHTARQVTGSLIRSAIRWCNVDTVPGSCAPAMFPSKRLHDLAPPSLPRVRADPVPLLHRYYEVLRFPAAPPAALRCLRTAVPRRASGCFAPLGPKRKAHRPGVRQSGLPSGSFAWKRQDVPGS